MIFPAVFSAGIEPTSGRALVFITLPSIFNSLPLSMVWSSIFFLLLADVYKRQCRKMVQGGGVSLNKEKVADAAREVTEADPVSYTHLDVYQRQRRGCGSRR